MKWTQSKEGELEVIDLTDPKYGNIGFIREIKRTQDSKLWLWEVEFAAEDLDLYWNEVFTGTIDMAKLRLLELAEAYLTNKISELSVLREILTSEMKVIKS